MKILKDQLTIQLPADGVHFELSPAYHCQVVADLLEAASVLNSKDKEWLMEALSRAVQSLSDLTHPDQLISLMSDGGLHMVYSPNEILEVWNRLTDQQVSPRACFCLKQSGYAGHRTGQTYLLVDWGPSCAESLPAHGHADLLSFEWDVDGLRMVVDQGVFEYEPGSRRLASRSAFSHNTITVGELDQCEFFGSFRTGWRSHANCIDCGLHGDQIWSGKGAYQHPTGHYRHTRTFLSSPTSLVVTDEINGVDQRLGGRPVVSRILLSHRAILESIAEKRATFRLGNAVVVFESSQPFRLEESQWWPDFGVSKPTTRIVMDYGSVDCHAEFRFSIQ